MFCIILSQQQQHILICFIAGENPIRAGRFVQPRPEEGERRALLQGECPSPHLLAGIRGLFKTLVRKLFELNLMGQLFRHGHVPILAPEF